MRRLQIFALAALVATAACATPAVAADRTRTLVAGPIRHRGHQVSLIASDGPRDSLVVWLHRRAGRSELTHMFTFNRGVNVTSRGNAPRIVARLGRYGTVRLTLRGMRARRGVVPPGCSGVASRAMVGTLRGRLDLRLGKPFKRISARSLRGARMGRSTIECGGATDPSAELQSGTVLTATDRVGGEQERMLMVAAIRDRDGRVTLQGVHLDQRPAVAPASIGRIATVPVSASAFKVAPSLTDATVVGSGPFMSGTLRFTATTPGTSPVFGTVGGTFAVRLPGLGVQRLSDEAHATLIRR